jgi:polypeptide N-acetylgalactosaminyltransferase
VFDWNLEYQKLSRFPVDDDKKLDPFPTPIMTGGIFMIRKDYFFELGPYDEELLIWGGENLEMSFKINLCGGKLLEVPCSRIGHVFRAFTMSRKHKIVDDFVAFNNKRIVEIWFDEFKEFVYKRDPQRYVIDVGDLTKAKKLKEKLKCKPFKYFFDEIAPDLEKKFPAKASPFASGRIQLKDENFCLEAPPEPDSPMLLNECYEPLPQSQSFELSWYRDIRIETTNLCIDYYNFIMTICEFKKLRYSLKFHSKFSCYLRSSSRSQSAIQIRPQNKPNQKSN